MKIRILLFLCIAISLVGLPIWAEDENADSSTEQLLDIDEEQCLEITIGVPTAGQIENPIDILCYKITVTGTEPLFVHLDKISGWNGRIAVYRGSLNGEVVGVSESPYDQMLQIDDVEPDTYYITVQGYVTSPVPYTLTARRSLDELVMNTPRQGQITHRYGASWYQVEITGTEPLFAHLDKTVGWNGRIAVYRGSLNGERVGVNDSPYDQMLQIDDVEPDTYYIGVWQNTALSVDYTLTARRSLDELVINTPEQGQITHRYGASWYQVEVTGTEPLFVHLDKAIGWNGHISVYKGSLNGEIVGISDSPYDQMLQIDDVEPDTYYIGVWQYSTWSVNYTLTARRSLDELVMDIPLPGQIPHRYAASWHQVELDTGGPLVIIVETTGNCKIELRIRKDVIPIEPIYWYISGTGRLELGLLVAEAGTYYIQILCTAGGGEYTIEGTTDINKATRPLILDNEVIAARVSAARACVTSLVFKPGTNQELIDASRDRYLIDFGSQDPDLKQYFKTGWQAQVLGWSANHVQLQFIHPSGFENQLSLIWDPGHVEVRAYIVAPEPVEIDNNISPGAGFHSGADKWAVPAVTGVQTGSFTYPGSEAWIYPSSNPDDWIVPSGGWMAFWNDDADEVHGFTFSGGYKLQVANSDVTDLHFMIPAGMSQISFQLLKPKPVTPYEAIELTSGPYFSLTNEVDKLFAGVGAELYYTLGYGNTGAGDATEVILENVLPSELEVDEASISDGGFYDPIGHSITWNIPALSAGSEMQTVTFMARIAGGVPNGTRIVNVARIRSAEEPIATVAEAIMIVGTPEITNISPDRGGNTGFASLKIEGRNLDPNAHVKLSRYDEPEINAIDVSSDSDGNQIIATFELEGRLPGAWDVIVVNPSGDSAVLPNDYTIESGGDTKLWLEIIGRDRARVGRNQTYTVRFGNSGTLNSRGFYFVIATPLTVKCDFDLPILEGAFIYDEPGNGGNDNVQITTIYSSGIPSGMWDQLQFKLQPTQTGIFSIDAYLLDLARIGQTTLEYAKVNMNPAENMINQTTKYKVRKIWFTHPRGYILGNKRYRRMHVALYCSDGYLWEITDRGITKTLRDKIDYSEYILLHKFDWPWSDTKAEEYYKNWIQHTYKEQEESGDEFLYCNEFGNQSQKGPICYSCDGWIEAGFEKIFKDIWGEKGLVDDEGKNLSVEDLYYALSEYDDEAPPWPPWEEWIEDIRVVPESELRSYDLLNRRRIYGVSSASPEDKYGPAGFDSQGTEPDQMSHYVRGNEPFGYRIDFWNKKDATAPTQDVFIEDQLHSNLDWDSFEFRDFGFLKWNVTVPPGKRELDETIDLRPDMSLLVRIQANIDSGGVVRWTFNSIDPYTGEPPEDPDAGFLPPITESGYEIGWVNFIVEPKDGLTTGDQISNQAFVKFDVGPWKPAPPNPDSEIPGYGPWVNTIDSGAPTSHVKPLPEDSSSTFMVEWEGTDDEGGSGVGYYTIYVSEDGISFDQWLYRASDTSAQFNGERGHTYYFYSRAEDNVGNVEQPPEVPDAFTKVTAPHWTLISIPYVLADSSLSKVLESIEGHYSSAWSYEASTKEWKRHFVNGPAFINNLYTIEAGKGYYIEMFDSTPLNVVGSEVADDPINLVDDWNLVGYNSLESKSCAEALASISGFYNSVWTYNFADGGWDKYVAGWPEEENDLETMDTWKGYWINANTPCSWDVNDMSTAAPSVAGRVNRRQVARNRPQLPYTIWGSIEADGMEITRKRDCTVILKINSEAYNGYKLGTLEQYGDYYVIDVPEDTGNSAQIELYVQIDADTVKAANVPRAEAGRAIQFDLSVDMVPETSMLRQNYPNPFNPDTWIPYQLSEDSRVEIKIFSVTGQLVRTLDLGHRLAGFYTSKEKAAYWDGRNEAGESVASGVYFYSIKAGGLMTTRKMVVAK